MIDLKIIKIIIYTLYPMILLVFLVILFNLFLFGNIITDVNDTSNLYESIIGFSLPLLISFCIIPYLIEKNFFNKSTIQLGLLYNKKKISYLQTSIFTTVSIIISVLGYKRLENELIVIISFIIVAICEEFYCRGLMYNVIQESFNEVSAILFNSIIFSIIYHSGGDIWINLLLRFPLAIILSLLRFKTKSIYDSVLLHYIYNVAISFI